VSFHPKPKCLFSISPLHSLKLEAQHDHNSSSLEKLGWALRAKRGLCL